MSCCRLHSLKVVCQRQEVNSRPSNLSVHVSPSRHTPRGRCCVRAKGVQGGLYLKKKTSWLARAAPPSARSLDPGKPGLLVSTPGQGCKFLFSDFSPLPACPHVFFSVWFSLWEKKMKRCDLTQTLHSPRDHPSVFGDLHFHDFKNYAFKGSEVQIRWSGMDLPPSTLLANQHLTFREVTFSFWVSVSENH